MKNCEPQRRLKIDWCLLAALHCLRNSLRSGRQMVREETDLPTFP
jgi:hypothetical protein